MLAMSGFTKTAFAETSEIIDQFGSASDDSAKGVTTDSTGVYVIGSTQGVQEPSSGSLEG